MGKILLIIQTLRLNQQKKGGDAGEPDALDIEDMKKKVADLEKTAEDLQHADKERLTQFGIFKGVSWLM